MADNVAITAGSGTSIATDDISGAHHQRVKISVGANGSATDLSKADPLPAYHVNGQLVDESGNELTVKTASIDLSSPTSGAHQIVAAVTGKKIRVLGLILSAKSTETVKLQDDAGTPKVLIGPMEATQSVFVDTHAPPGRHLGETGTAQDLDLDLANGFVDIGGVVIYVEV